jgi:hypothetical protein
MFGVSDLTTCFNLSQEYGVVGMLPLETPRKGDDALPERRKHAHIRSTQYLIQEHK